MVLMVDAQRWTKFVHGRAWCSYYSFHFFFWVFLFGAWILTLYSPSQLILTFHLSIRQILTRVPVLSAASPYFLLIAIIETTLFRGLFPSMWLGCLLAHSMRRWRLLPEPIPRCTPVRVPFYLPFFSGSALEVAFDGVLSFPFRPWDAENKVILGCIPRLFGILILVLGNYSPRRGP